jgi:hypothetical protein
LFAEITPGSSNVAVKPSIPANTSLIQRPFWTEAVSQEESTDSVLNKNENLIVGIMSSSKPRYIKSLLAQSETWLPAFPKERVFALGPDISSTSDPVLPGWYQPLAQTDIYGAKD